MSRMMARLQVLPDGIIIGHIVPTEGCPNLQVGVVYEVSEDFFETLQIEPIGPADYPMPTPPMSLASFLVKSGGYHLTINNGR